MTSVSDVDAQTPKTLHGSALAARMDRLTALAKRMNRASGSAIKMLSERIKLSAQLESIASAVVQLNSSIHELSRAGRELEGHANDAADCLSSTKQEASAISTSVQRAVEISQEATKAVERLNERSEEVGRFVASIESIAAQTNLLSLNAAIESARAGESGRGFSVVASEVRALAQQTAVTTADIREKVEFIQADVASVAEVIAQNRDQTLANQTSLAHITRSIASLQEIFHVVSTTSSELASVLSQQQLASEEVSGATSALSSGLDSNAAAINDMVEATNFVFEFLQSEVNSMPLDQLPNRAIRLGKLDHLVWVKELADMLAGRNPIAVQDCVDHHQCRLGRWYDGPGQATAGHIQSFRDLERPHAQLHQLKREAVEYYARRDFESAVESVLRIVEQSQQILRLLDDVDHAMSQETGLGIDPS